MKDLITTIGAVTILMVFVLQFANNQAIATRILAADSLCDSYFAEMNAPADSEQSPDDIGIGMPESGGTDTPAAAQSQREFIEKLAKTLNCSPSDISLEQNLQGYHIKAYINQVIACADFLGITEEQNRAEYQWFSARGAAERKHIGS